MAGEKLAKASPSKEEKEGENKGEKNRGNANRIPEVYGLPHRLLTAPLVLLNVR